MIRKIVSSSLVILFGFILIPGESLHQLFEEHHNEEHHCHSDLCIREFEFPCELGHYKITETLKVETNLIVVPTAYFVLESDLPEDRTMASHIAMPPNKAPPIC